MASTIDQYEKALSDYEFMVKEAVEKQEDLDKTILKLIETRKQLFDILEELKKQGENIQNLTQNV